MVIERKYTTLTHAYILVGIIKRSSTFLQTRENRFNLFVTTGLNQVSPHITLNTVASKFYFR